MRAKGGVTTPRAAPGTPVPSAGLGPDLRDPVVLHEGTRFAVYAAIEPDGRAVAVKVPTGATWTHDALRREAGLLVTIGAHPHVVALLRETELPDGRPALVLARYTQRLSQHLSQRLSQHPADAEASGEPGAAAGAVATGIKLAGALEVVHSAGVLHCDVRPENVLFDAAGEPALTGWGEAAIVGDTGIAAPRHLTTPHTAPELLEGATPSPATDTYGLAATVYEMVAGHAPFREYEGESAASVAIRVLSATVTPIVRPGVPLELSDLLRWALAAEPARRPPSPAWLAEEFARIASRAGWPRTPRLRW